jgi:hypothetical protein
MTTPSPPSSEDLFDLLVKNALDFLEQSVAALQKRPKDSLIQFYAALELFLKARLMREHWTQIVVNPGKANLTAFKQGALVSVGLPEAIDRLRNVAGEVITADEEQCFDSIRRHRNRVVHFFHEKYASPDAKAIEEVVTEQCKAWAFLHDLLTRRWASQFGAYAQPIGKMHEKMKANRSFLKAKYNAMFSMLQAQVAAGATYTDCSSCGFKSLLVEELEEPLYKSTCQVCGATRRFLEVPCEVCGESLSIRDGAAECENDGFEIDLDWLLSKYGPLRDPKEDSKIGYCSECGETGPPSVIPHGSDGYLCLTCAWLYHHVENCEWCGALNAGLRDQSYLNGCAICDGKFGSESFAKE